MMDRQGGTIEGGQRRVVHWAEHNPAAAKNTTTNRRRSM